MILSLTFSAQVLGFNVRTFHWFQKNIPLDGESDLKTIIGDFDTGLLHDGDAVQWSFPLEFLLKNMVFPHFCSRQSVIIDPASTWCRYYFLL